MRWLIPSLYERRARETNNPRLPAVAFTRYQERIPERIQPISKWIELIYGLCGPASRPDCKLNRNREPPSQTLRVCIHRYIDLLFGSCREHIVIGTLTEIYV